jgi:hypothetical protein
VTTGAKVDAKVWKEIRELYVQGKTDRGWCYHNSEFSDYVPSRTMTASALVGLVIVSKHLDKVDNDIQNAEKDGLVNMLDLHARRGRLGMSEWYYLHTLAEYRSLTGESSFGSGTEKILWHREAVEKLLKTQQKSGAWVGESNVDKMEIYGTACGLMVLGKP